MTSRRNIQSRLLASTIFATTALVATPAFAQAQPAAQTAENNDDAIVVTGTLIRNPNLVASAPVQSVGQEEISLRQRNTAEEVLRDLPGATPSIGSAVNNGNGGSAFADLRGLGNFRNVVLLDGARIVPSNFIGRVDLNNIPLALVERVDTLTGGAATTYGADAVSGVINFITRQDFAGAEISASQQITEEGDGNVFRVDATIGANFDDGRGNATLSLGYQEADAVYQGARRFSINNYTSTSGGLGGSGTTVPARFTRPGVGPGNQNTLVPATGLTRPYVGATDAFNFNPYNIYQTPFERFNIFAQARYEVADGIEFYTRGMFSKNTVNTIIAPSGIFGQLALIPLSSPFLPAGARAQFCETNDFDFNTPGIQTLTPAQCTAAATALTPADPNFRAVQTNIGRRIVETGPRLAEFLTTMFDYRAGLRIDVTDSINLDLSGAYGESENRATLDGYISISRLRTALYTSSATTCNLGPSPTVPNPNPALPPLAGSGAGTTGCVPVNVFGPAGSISPAMIPYITAIATNSQRSSLSQARALLSGDFGASMPWANDPIGFALGAEYRGYQAAQTADQLSQTAGELGGAGGAVLPFTGGYSVYEAYAELIAPIVQDRAFFHSLTLEAGIRYSDYSIDTAGSPGYNTTTWKLAANWEPMQGLRFRGNYQRAVRAPNIAELFLPRGTGLTTLTTDPCRTTRNTAGVITFAGPLANADLRAVCLLQGAQPAQIGLIANPTAAQANATVSGGLYLRPETSDSYTIGLVFQPRFIPGLSLTIDYYHIVIEDAISQPGPGDLINACFGDANGTGVTAASVTNPSCLLFQRNPVTGGLDGDPATTIGLIFPASNAGRILTDGVDFGFNYRRDLGFARLNLSFNGNWTNRSQFEAIVPGSIIPPGFPGAGQPFTPIPVRECVGLYGPNCGSPGSAGPSSAPGSIQAEWTWNARATFSFDDIDLSLLWRHISSVQAEPGIVLFQGTIAAGALAGEEVDFANIPAYDYFDLAARFGINDNLDITLTVQNLFDKDPPIVGGNTGTVSFNSGNTYPSTYDALGRRFAVGARLRF